jgi:hypothetical protein
MWLGECEELWDSGRRALELSFREQRNIMPSLS